MMNSLWIAKTGMTAQQTQLDVISHNLANVSTTGFKRNNAVFEDLIYQNLRQVGANTTEQNQLPTGLHLGLGVRTVATSRNFTQTRGSYLVWLNPQPSSFFRSRFSPRAKYSSESAADSSL